MTGRAGEGATAGDQFECAARRLAGAHRVVVFTGAGVSKESGIATFREGEDAVWNKYDAMEMATMEGYLRDPSYVWAWYQYRFGLVEGCDPNPAHVAIAEMERLVPELAVVTQNIDGLHQRGGSSTVLELHGSIRRFKCLHGRHGGFTREEVERQADRPPRCPECGELIRPDVVWFGEMLPEGVLQESFRLAQRCDVMLVVGTSGVVQPAALLPHVARESHAFVIDVNPQRGESARAADVFLKGAAGEVLPRLVDGMREVAAQNGLPV